MDEGCAILSISKESETIGIFGAERQANGFAKIPVYLGMSSHVLSASEVVYLTANSDSSSEHLIFGRISKTNDFSDPHMIATCACFSLLDERSVNENVSGCSAEFLADAGPGERRKKRSEHIRRRSPNQYCSMRRTDDAPIQTGVKLI